MPPIPKPAAVVRYRLARSLYAGDPYGSHAPALTAALPAAFGLASLGGTPTVFEVGCGSHSTPAILGFASGCIRPCRYIAFEHDPGCINNIVTPLLASCPPNVRGLVYDLRAACNQRPPSNGPESEAALIAAYLDAVRELAAATFDVRRHPTGSPNVGPRPALALLDSWPAAGRLPLLRELRKTFPIIVVHDTEPTGEYGLEAELNSFRYRLDVTPQTGVGIYAKLATPDPHPWTSVLSDSLDVTDLLAGYTMRLNNFEPPATTPAPSPTPAEPAD